jgi:hypothetical protein
VIFKRSKKYYAKNGEKIVWPFEGLTPFLALQQQKQTLNLWISRKKKLK